MVAITESMESILQRSACPCDNGNSKPISIVCSLFRSWTLFLFVFLQRLKREYPGESKSHEELFIYRDASSRGRQCASIEGLLLTTTISVWNASIREI